jgi:hypothetical protein
MVSRSPRDLRSQVLDKSHPVTLNIPKKQYAEMVAKNKAAEKREVVDLTLSSPEPNPPTQSGEKKARETVKRKASPQSFIQDEFRANKKVRDQANEDSRFKNKMDDLTNAFSTLWGQCERAIEVGQNDLADSLEMTYRNKSVPPARIPDG